ncbi:hypothetical protein [Reyranella sp. CPCC 100927]|uniref:hypothetical protein n=1 Tax=Reyranella sp. CPCC 100927 TaxID=2599616 RepID=UPI0011B5AB7F|nr:hypothetical protein [Reyranella sp. CPCC 100927]TWT14059.1 hypothetical protein FQU96_09195 [Reyranella sp. CPCC 100927]
MLIFFHLALRRMAERHRQSQPEVDRPAVVGIVRPGGRLSEPARRPRRSEAGPTLVAVRGGRAGGRPAKP